jgi:hypothetical protein
VFSTAVFLNRAVVKTDFHTKSIGLNSKTGYICSRKQQGFDSMNRAVKIQTGCKLRKLFQTGWAALFKRHVENTDLHSVASRTK